jgi:hypothetical protein
MKPLMAAREGMIANWSIRGPITFMIAFLPQFVDPHGSSPVTPAGGSMRTARQVPSKDSLGFTDCHSPSMKCAAQAGTQRCRDIVALGDHRPGRPLRL